MKTILNIRILFAFVSALLFTGVINAHSTDPAFAEDSVVVMGTGFIDAEPDIVDLNFQLYAVKPNLKEAKSSVDVLYRKALMVIKQYKVADKDIKLTQMNSYKEYEWNKQDRTFKGHRLSRNLQVTVREKEIYPELLQGLVDAGISEVNNVSPRIADKSKVKEQALAKAIEAAKYKAKFMAQQFGRELGDVIFVSEVQTQTVSPRNFAVRAAQQMEPSAPQEQFGAERVTAKITVTYRLK
jgi:uncharacterized protein YggE